MAKNSKAEKINWLLENKNLWKGKIDPHTPKTCLEEIDALALAALKAGIWSEKTILGDIRIGVVKLLRDPRLS